MIHDYIYFCICICTKITLIKTYLGKIIDLQCTLITPCFQQITQIFYKKLLCKKLSVLKPQRLRNLYFFLSLSYDSFGDTVANFEKDMYILWSNSYSQ